MNKTRNYQEVQVMTCDRVRLIIMLYDGIIRFNKCAQKSIEEKDIQGRSHYINRALAIISELSNSLNMEEGGEIAKNLYRLYEYSTQQLTFANLRNNAAPIEIVTKIISELKGGWEKIAADKAQSPEARQVNGGISCGV